MSGNGNGNGNGDEWTDEDTAIATAAIQNGNGSWSISSGSDISEEMAFLKRYYRAIKLTLTHTQNIRRRLKYQPLTIIMIMIYLSIHPLHHTRIDNTVWFDIHI